MSICESVHVCVLECVCMHVAEVSDSLGLESRMIASYLLCVVGTKLALQASGPKFDPQNLCKVFGCGRMY